MQPTMCFTNVQVFIYFMFANLWLVVVVGLCPDTTPDQYTYQTIQTCTSNPVVAFRGLTVNGSDIHNLDAIKNYTYTGTASFFRVNGTSMTNLNGLPVNAVFNRVHTLELTVENCPLLTSIALKLRSLAWFYFRNLPLLTSIDTIFSDITVPYLFTTSTTFLEVSGCPLVTSIRGPSPSFNFVFGVHITNNAGLVEITGFDAPLTTLYVQAPNTPASYPAIEISGNPQLTTISIYPSVAVTPSVVIRNNARLLNGGGVGIPTISGYAIISDNPLLSVLGTKFTSVVAFYVERNPSITDWTSLYRFTSLPTTFSAAGSACPSYTFFDTPSVFTRVSFAGCKDLLTVTAVSVLEGPVTGGVETLITVEGVLAEPTFNATFISDASPAAAAQTTCTLVANMQFRCVVPPSIAMTSANIRIRASTMREWITTSFQFTYVSVVSHFGADLLAAANSTDGNTIYTAPEVAESTKGLPGVPESRSAETAQRTGTVAIFLGVFLLCFVLLVIITSVFCGHHRHCGLVLDYLVIIDAFKMIREDARVKKTDDGYVMRRQGSRIGGTMMVVVVAIGIGIVFVALLNYFMDNTSKSDTQQPVDDPPIAFQSAYVATVLSHGHHACTIGSTGSTGSNSSCDPLLTVTMNGFKAVRPTAGDGLTCSAINGGGCKVEYRCGECTLSSTSASLKVNDGSANAYALSFAYSVTSVDYFGQLSVASGSVSADGGSVMKGSNSPALATVTLTPAHFDNFGTVSDGVLSKAVGTSSGNQLQLSQFGNAQGMGFNLNIAANQNARFVSLSQKNSAFETAGSTAGLISGLLAVASILTWIIFKTIDKTKNSGLVTPPINNNNNNNNKKNNSTIELLV
jgi:hypothetical protein